MAYLSYELECYQKLYTYIHVRVIIYSYTGIPIFIAISHGIFKQNYKNQEK